MATEDAGTQAGPAAAAAAPAAQLARPQLSPEEQAARGEAPVKAEFLRATTCHVHVGAVTGGQIGAAAAAVGQGQPAPAAAAAEAAAGATAGEGQRQRDVQSKSKKKAKKVRGGRIWGAAGCSGQAGGQEKAAWSMPSRWFARPSWPPSPGCRSGRSSGSAAPSCARRLRWAGAPLATGAGEARAPPPSSHRLAAPCGAAVQPVHHRGWLLTSTLPRRAAVCPHGAGSTMMWMPTCAASPQSCPAPAPSTQAGAPPPRLPALVLALGALPPALAPPWPCAGPAALVTSRCCRTRLGAPHPPGVAAGCCGAARCTVAPAPTGAAPTVLAPLACHAAERCPYGITCRWASTHAHPDELVQRHILDGKQPQQGQEQGQEPAARAAPAAEGAAPAAAAAAGEAGEQQQGEAGAPAGGAQGWWRRDGTIPGGVVELQAGAAPPLDPLNTLSKEVQTQLRCACCLGRPA